MKYRIRKAVKYWAVEKLHRTEDNKTWYYIIHLGPTWLDCKNWLFSPESEDYR